MRNLSRNLFLIVLCLLPASLFGQARRFSATTGDVSLAGAGTAFTVQQPATNGKRLVLESATVYCSVTCNATQSVNGTAATATAGTTVALQPDGQPSVATVWTASNAGAGTAIGGIFHLAAAVTQTFDLSKLSLSSGLGTGANYTVTISSITGTANITFIWSEQ
jgi:hypothetical protein